MILAGDLGGTKADLGLFTLREGALVELASERFESAHFSGFDSMIRAFLQNCEDSPDKAVFGVPGPVLRDRARATNLPWELDARQLEASLGIPEVELVNDLVATAAGLLDLPAEKFETIYQGERHARGTRAVMAPGTGLGQAFLVWDGTLHHALPSEGGHADFAPRNALEISLLQHGLESADRLSYEHLLAGPGIGRIYEFLRDREGWEEPANLASRLRAAPDRNAGIGEAGLAGEAGIAVETLRLWSSLLGAEAGNMALRTLALGGVYLGGGIVTKLLPVLRQPAFREAYLAKGKLSGFVAKIPVVALLDDRAALRGAAHIALRGDGI